jgi:hypothetical protein
VANVVMYNFPTTDAAFRRAFDRMDDAPPGWRLAGDNRWTRTTHGGGLLVVTRWHSYETIVVVDYLRQRRSFATLAEACAAAELHYCGARVRKVG